MTYCVGMMLQSGLAFMSDTRTNAGLDNVSTFKKMSIWENTGDRVMTLLSSGNLGTTQAVISLLEERMKAPDETGSTSLFTVPSMFSAARLVADTMREVIDLHRGNGQQANTSFGATLILGGQIAGEHPRLFMIYPEGNFIEASEDTPFFQTGETKYGRPILVRAYDPALTFEKAIKLLLVSFDSTVKANLSVGAPFDYHLYRADSLQTGLNGRIEADDPYLQTLADGWGRALQNALDSQPDIKLTEHRP